MTQLLLAATLPNSTPTNLAEALARVDARIDGWASSSAAYATLLGEVFSNAGTAPGLWQQAAATLQGILQSTGLTIRLELLGGDQLQGLNGTYTASARGGGVRIYLNSSWMQSASVAEIEAVLLEEVGHAIDTYLNPDFDSPGDEGENFSALLRGESPSTVSLNENDQHTLNLDGQAVAIEAADTSAPVALTTNPAYSTATTNPFGLADVGYDASSNFVDIDGDGDFDVFIGNSRGDTLFFRNTAPAGSTTPAYAAAVTNAFGLAGVGYVASPSFVDIDGDGDLDAFIGNFAGDTLFFRNNAASGSSNPSYDAATSNPFGLANMGGNTVGGNLGGIASPSFVDIDGDGDLDAFLGNSSGRILFFRNTTASGSTNPAYAAAISNPFGLADVGRAASPNFVDNDGDGDFDVFIGNADGNTLFFRNTAPAGSTTPAYAAAATNPFGLADVGIYANSCFADIDGDGDLDAFIGDHSGNTLFFRNTAPAFGVSSITANGSYGVGSVINLTLTFSESVIVTGIPTLHLETGSIDRHAVYIGGSGSSTLTFSYTVQAGDRSADLDLLSTNALSLNAGSIKDAAGNNAVLTLAAPGSPASLGARKNLVIARSMITSVTSSTANGVYRVGAVVILTVTLSEPVLVTGTPQLQLETGSNDRFAIYIGGSGTSTLTFSYTVQRGDNAIDLDVVSSSALSLNGGTVKDVAFGINASLSLAAPGASGSLGANKNLVIDTGAPVALTTTPAYAAPATNPFGLADVGLYYFDFPTPSLVDIDRDGDLDAFIGGRNGAILFYRNIAAAGSTTPAFAPPATNPFGLADVGSFVSPSFADIDGDGDLDAFIGNFYRNILFFRNIAAAGSTTPSFAPPVTKPFGLADVGYSPKSLFVDIDGDGDLDAFIGNNYGNTLFLRNTAAAGSTSPAYAFAAINPFGLGDVGYGATPSFVDIDGDGDLDAFIGNSDGITRFYRNTAAAGSTTPAYASAVINPFGLGDVGYDATPSMVDIDDDGDLDAFVGSSGYTLFFRNTAPALGVSSTTANGSYGVGAVINLTLTFSEPVLVTGSPQLQLETGSTDRYAVYTGGSGSSTLTFSYTVQAGDSAADLDLISPNALSLNGGSIKDGAGRIAGLTLAALGSPASLAGRKNLLIEARAVITGVTSPIANGVYGVGAVIILTVTYSQPVLVTGAPRLLLETGSIDRFAIYTGGSGTSTLTFAYTVQPGDNATDLDVLSSSALSLGGGTIKDAADNTASLSLAAVGAPGSLGVNKNLLIDATPPVALTTTPAYVAVNSNVFGLRAVWLNYATSPDFVDIDGDGDLDAFIGNSQGNILFLRNTAPAGSTNPAYAYAYVTNPFGLADVGSYASPEMVDIDGDGDLDSFIGNREGNTLFFRNTGAAGSTNPAYAAAVTNPFGLTDVGGSANPSFVDIDGDGDLDAFIGEEFGNTLFFRNTGAAGSSNPAYAAAVTNAFGLADVGTSASPSFVDTDGDGDLDAFIGNWYGNTLFFRNTAAAGNSNPAYATAAVNPFGLEDVGSNASPSFLDIDADGDLDAFIGNGYGETLFSRNTAPALGVSSTTANGSYGVGAVINLTLTFSESVLVSGAPQLQLETGSTDRYAVYTGGSGSNTLTFSYTVQVGDRSADLDLVSANALSLNGGSIKDAIGHNAVLRLAAPGLPASLAGRKNLVIKNDATPPVITGGPTAIGTSGISVTSNEAGSAALYKADNSQLFPTALTANTPATLTLAAQAVVTTATLKVADNDGNLTAAAPTFLLGTNGADGMAGTAAADFLYGFSGKDSLTGAGGNDTLIGSDGYDSYLFDTDAALGSDTLNEAGGGGDTLNFAATTTRSIALNLGLATAQVVNANLILTLGSAATFEIAIGGSLADTFTGNSLNNRLTGGGGNDTLIGGAGYDSYLFAADVALGSDTLNEAGGGGDTLNFAATNTAAIALNLGLSTSQVVNANLILTLGSAATFENAVGGALADTITGNSLNNRLTGGGGNDTLIGGAGYDSYLFDTDAALGSDTLNEADGGSDTLNFSATATRSIALNLGLATSQVINSNLSLTLGSGATFENVIGGSLADAITGNSLNNRLTGGGGNDTLVGGLGADRFRFATALNATSNNDVISDFTFDQGDRIELENAFFTALPTTGPLAASEFLIGTAATNGNQRILYNNATGLLSYDSDGNGAEQAVAFAMLTSRLSLTSDSFSVT